MAIANLAVISTTRILGALIRHQSRFISLRRTSSQEIAEVQAREVFRPTAVQFRALLGIQLLDALSGLGPRNVSFVYEIPQVESLANTCRLTHWSSSRLTGAASRAHYGCNEHERYIDH